MKERDREEQVLTFTNATEVIVQFPRGKYPIGGEVVMILQGATRPSYVAQDEAYRMGNTAHGEDFDYAVAKWPGTFRKPLVGELVDFDEGGKIAVPKGNMAQHLEASERRRIETLELVARRDKFVKEVAERQELRRAREEERRQKLADEPEIEQSLKLKREDEPGRKLGR